MKYHNPYLNFFKNKVPYIWRSKIPPQSIEEKAQELSENIAQKFVDWSDNLEIPLNINNILAMFFPREGSVIPIRVNSEELRALPIDLAKYFGIPEQSKREILLKEVYKDFVAAYVPKKTIAFGKTLPRDLKILPNKSRNFEKFLHTKRIPTELQTLETVFQGICQLHSTRGFYKFILKTQSYLEVPEYLRLYYSNIVLSKQEIYRKSIMSLMTDTGRAYSKVSLAISTT